MELHKSVKPGTAPARIVKILDGLAVDVRNDVEYEQHLDPDVIQTTKNELAQAMIDFMKAEDEYRETMSKAKAAVNAASERWHELTRIVRHGKARRRGSLYYLQDLDDNMIRVCNAEGIIIEEKPIGAGDQLALVPPLFEGDPFGSDPE